MNNKIFNILVNKVSELNTNQFRILRENVDKRVKSKKVSNILETPFSEIKCPYCNKDKILKWGIRSDMQRYKCKSCNKTFNSLTHTPLARLRRKGHWLDYSECLKKGITIRKAATNCEIHRNTSFRWRHRFIDNLKQIKAKELSGVIETGDISLKESFKGAKKNHKELFKERKTIKVIFNIDRNQNIFDLTNIKLNINNLNKLVSNNIEKDSMILLESEKYYIDFAKQQNIQFIVMKENKTINNLVSIQKLLSYKEEFSKWIFNHFRGVATKYLENYVSWYRCLNEFEEELLPLTLLYRAKQPENYKYQPLKVTSMVL